MRKLIIISLIAIAPFLLKAQLTNFDLSSYKLPEIKRHQLDLNFDFSGRSYSNDQNYRNSTDYYNKSNYVDGDIGLGYSYYKNSSRIQSNQNYRMMINSSFEDRKSENKLLEQSYDINGYFSLNSDNRLYFKPTTFFELDFNLDVNTGISNAENKEYESSSEYNNKSVRTSVPLLMGFGRIEQIQDARLALYILDELNKKNILSRIPNNEEILEFSQLISKLKSERFFDSREKKIYELEEVDKFLQSKGLVEDNDVKYFSIVNDNWDFAATQIREAGKRLSFGVMPELYYYDRFSEYKTITSNSDNEYNKIEYGISAIVKYNIEKPINIYWQSSFDISTSVKYLIGSEENVTNGFKTDLVSPQINSSIYYSLGFYPNTRTNLNLSFRINYNNYFGEEDINGDKNDINHFELNTNSMLHLNYYISRQLKLNANYSVYYNYRETNSEYYANAYDDYTTYKSFSQYFRIGFIYQIF